MKKLLRLSRLLYLTNEKDASHQILKIYKYASEIYTIKPGDTLGKVTKGDIRWQRLVESENPNVDWNRLQIGQEINLPPQPTRPNESMSYSNELINFVMELEDYRPTRYEDINNNPIIGWGHKIMNSEEQKYNFQYVMPLDEASIVLKDDLNFAASYVIRNIDVPLNQYQFDAVTGLVFNMGIGSFHNTNLRSLIDQGRFSEATKEILTTKAEGLGSRRAKESRLFSLGQY